eukprot:tig00020629_g12365.t1
MSSDDLFHGASIRSFQVISELHRSGTGAVYRAKYLKDGKTYVIKERRQAELGKNRDVTHELQLLQRIQHPNVIRCHGHFWDPAHRVLFIVLEYADGGDLRAFVEKRAAKREYLTEKEVLLMFAQICAAIQHLHAHNIVHRDIKSLNILMSSSGTIKVGDLGVGRFKSDQTAMLNTFYGTPLYASPELCQNQPYDERTDVWSLGVVLYELAALRLPFTGRTLTDLARAINAAYFEPLPRQFSPRLQSLVKAMLSKEFAKRPTAAQVVESTAEAMRALQIPLPECLRDQLQEPAPAAAPAAAPAPASAPAPRPRPAPRLPSRPPRPFPPSGDPTPPGPARGAPPAGPAGLGGSFVLAPPRRPPARPGLRAPSVALRPAARPRAPAPPLSPRVRAPLWYPSAPSAPRPQQPLPERNSTPDPTPGPPLDPSPEPYANGRRTPTDAPGYPNGRRTPGDLGYANGRRTPTDAAPPRPQSGLGRRSPGPEPGAQPLEEALAERGTETAGARPRSGAARPKSARLRAVGDDFQRARAGGGAGAAAAAAASSADVGPGGAPRAPRAPLQPAGDDAAGHEPRFERVAVAPLTPAARAALPTPRPGPFRRPPPRRPPRPPRPPATPALRHLPRPAPSQRPAEADGPEPAPARPARRARPSRGGAPHRRRRRRPRRPRPAAPRAPASVRRRRGPPARPASARLPAALPARPKGALRLSARERLPPYVAHLRASGGYAHFDALVARPVLAGPAPRPASAGPRR